MLTLSVLPVSSRSWTAALRSLIRTMFSAVGASTLMMLCVLLRLLSWVTKLLLCVRLLPILHVTVILLLPLLLVNDTISRSQELIGVCNAAFVVEVLQQFLPHVVTAKQMLVAYQCTRHTLNMLYSVI